MSKKIDYMRCIAIAANMPQRKAAAIVRTAAQHHQMPMRKFTRVLLRHPLAQEELHKALTRYSEGIDADAVLMELQA